MSQSDLPPAPLPPALLEAALYCDDLDRAEAFYAGILGLPRIQRVGNRHVFFRAGTGTLLVFNADETEKPPTNPAMPVPPHGARGPGHACLAMPAEGITAWETRLRAAGVEIEADFTWPNGARSLYFRDPCGNSLEFAEPWLWDES
ncbi:VOC family protein [Thalassococcus sp. BH17M4-6]|uniref:VOC family protein n=1 Tax=Thalassococcus sp. BH17M4-6 TaxID=3413148 RepID=UPI003BBB5F94